jgi:hypothetical protein
MMKDDVENIFKTSTDNNSPAALKLSWQNTEFRSKQSIYKTAIIY